MPVVDKADRVRVVEAIHLLCDTPAASSSALKPWPAEAKTLHCLLHLWRAAAAQGGFGHIQDSVQPYRIKERSIWEPSTHTSRSTHLAS